MTSSLRNWVKLNPLARYALAGVLGIVLTDYGFTDVPGRDGALLAWMVMALLTFLFSKWIPRELTIFFVFVWLHHARLESTYDHPLRTSLPLDDRIEGVVTGYLIPSPATGSGDQGGRQQVTLLASNISLTQKKLSINNPTVLRGWMTSSEPLPPAGTYEIQGRLRLPSRPTNPGQFDGAAHSLREGIVADMDVRQMSLKKADSMPVRTWLLQRAESCREWISLQLQMGIEDQPEALSLIRGMALGAIDDTSADLERPFRDTGTLHVFAVSGLHVGLFSTIGWTALSWLGVRRTIALAILIPGVFAYAFITGWRPSAARAAIMIAVYMAASLFDRQSRVQNNLGAAALIILGCDTHQLFMPGFQLSFGVLWAIALMAGPVIAWLKPWTSLDEFLPPQVASRGQHASSQIRTFIGGTLAVSVSAWLGSLPLMLWHFGVVTPVAVIANCFLVPLASVVLGLATASLALAAVHLTWVQVITNSLNGFFAKMMLGGAILFSKVPGATLNTTGADIAHRPPIEMTVFHLPYGEAAQHLRLDQSHWLLDTGTKKSFNRILEPFLQMQACSRLDGIVLSHSDIDHVGGAVSADRDYGQPSVYISALEPWRLESSLSSLKQFIAKRTTEGEPVRKISETDRIRFAPEIEAEVLHPRPRDFHDKGDDRALVLLIHMDGFRILWCNDAGFITEKQIMERHLFKNIRCDVLIRNQHATDYSGLTEFLQAAAPRLIISSNVPYLAEEAMPPSVIQYAAEKGVPLLDQDIHGAITLSIHDEQLFAKGFVTGKAIALQKRKR